MRGKTPLRESEVESTESQVQEELGSTSPRTSVSEKEIAGSGGSAAEKILHKQMLLRVLHKLN